MCHRVRLWKYVPHSYCQTRMTRNSPEPWQIATLRDWEQRQATGEDPRTFECFEQMNESATQARYLKPIVTGELCTVCHGASISNAVQSALDEHYPHDRATANRENNGSFPVLPGIWKKLA